MKVTILFSSFLFISSLCISQSKKELQEQITLLNSQKQSLNEELNKYRQDILDLKEQMITLKEENSNLRIQLKEASLNQPKTEQATQLASPIKQELSVSGRCQAITAKGSQCSRMAEAGSNYCWQHRSTYEPTTKPKTSSASSSSSNSSGRTIYTGPRGGKYYINKNGNKTYVK